jgi:hypothetical protein
MSIRIVELNTASPKRFSCFRGFDDMEREQYQCPKCGYWLFSETNYFGFDDSKFHRRWTKIINETHLELCEGDPVITLMKVEQTWKELVTRPQQEKCKK